MQPKYKSSLTNPRIANFEWQEPEDESDRGTFRKILEHGCSIITIEPDADGPELPSDFAYTLGFYLNLGHPEFLIIGISGETAWEMLNGLFSYVEGGNTISENQTISYELEGKERILVAKNVPDDRYFDYMGYAVWFYRSLLWNVEPVGENKFPVLQLVWPDKNGFYPWDDECDPSSRKIQTLVEFPDDTE